MRRALREDTVRRRDAVKTFDDAAVLVADHTARVVRAIRDLATVLVSYCSSTGRDKGRLTRNPP